MSSPLNPPLAAPVGAASVPPTRLDDAAAGALYATGAFLAWGLLPIFWKVLRHVPSSELLAYRVLWSAVMMLALLSWRRHWPAFRRLLRPSRTLVTLATTTVLIAFNWFLYVWAVNHDRLLETSLGYFINPLLTVVLGLLFLGERLRPWQVVSVALATLGVLLLTWRLGELPWIAVALSVSFAFYSLLRKTMPVTPEEGLTLETFLLSPLMLAYLGWVHGPSFGLGAQRDLLTEVLLALGGVVTALPLIWFTHAARRLPLSTIGIFQYLSPTCQFLLAVFLYREPFGAVQLVAFSFIWAALFLFTADAQVHWQRRRRLQALAAPTGQST